MLNDGLEALGTNERTDDGYQSCGAFERSALEQVRLPSTLKRIEANTFCDCRRL